MAISDEHPFLRRVARATAVALVIAALFVLVWKLGQIILMVFGGILLAVLLRALGDWVADHTPLNRTWGWVVAIVAVVGVFVGLGFLIAPRVSEQVDRLSTQLPEAFNNLTQGLGRYDWGAWLLERVREFEPTQGGGPDFVQRVTGVVSLLLTAVTGAVVVLFLGLYLSFQPRLYRQGFLHLLPRRNRARFEQVFLETGETLKWWFFGKLAAMLIVGVATAVGLYLLGVPLALTLALLAALLTFIPNFGPILSAVPAVALGFAERPMLGVWVIVLYLGIQTVESYFITPILLRRAVDTPPALLLTTQVVLGLLMGFLGLLLADPLLAAAMVWVRRFWVEDTPGDELEAQHGPLAEG